MDRDTLVEHASSQGADEEITKALQGLPERTYGSPTEVSEAITRG